MSPENFNPLQKLIKTLKNQEPLLPIEGIEKLSQGFFNGTSKWYQSYIKPAMMMAAAAIIIMSSIFVFNKKDSKPNRIADAKTNPNSTKSISAIANDSIIKPLTKDETMKPEAYKNLKLNKNPETIDETKGTKNNHMLAYVLTNADSIILNSLTAPIQKFEINPLMDTLITGIGGTKIVFYKTCFEDSFGNVVKEPIEINLKECYRYPDMVKENLNTQSDSNILESKGMVWVDASSNGKRLKLRSGYDCPIEFVSSEVNNFDLFYATAGKFEETNWQLDPLGKIPNPVIIPNRGRYWDITFNYFMDNYKMDKSTMLALNDKKWNVHFTSVDTKMVGFTACSSENLAQNMACIKFRELCNSLYQEIPTLKHSSWVTDFGFSCISRDSLNIFLENDTIRSKVNKEIFRYNMSSPFYFSRTGWINCDHPFLPKFPRANTNEVVISNYPSDGYTLTYLLLKNRKIIVNQRQIGLQHIFLFLPRNSQATVFSYKLNHGKISYVQQDINTSDNYITLGKYEALEDSNALIEKINGVTEQAAQ